MKSHSINIVILTFYDVSNFLRRIFRYFCLCLSHNVTRKLILCTCISREVRLKQVLLFDVCTLKKKYEKKFPSYIRKFIREELQSHMTNASSYMVKYLRISSYIRKPFLLYDFATAPIWISYYMRNISFSFLSVLYKYIIASPKYRNGGHNNSLSSWKAAISRHRATTYEILISVRYYG